ncbi:hypothetical protein LXA43DRAFT_958407, partial [Ganoderma leucocontextum]
MHASALVNMTPAGTPALSILAALPPPPAIDPALEPAHELNDQFDNAHDDANNNNDMQLDGPLFIGPAFNPVAPIAPPIPAAIPAPAIPANPLPPIVAAVPAAPPPPFVAAAPAVPLPPIVAAAAPAVPLAPFVAAAAVPGVANLAPGNVAPNIGVNAPVPVPAAIDNIPDVLPPAAYTIALNPTGGSPLLNRQHPHIRRTIRGVLPRLEVYLVTEHAFPDAVIASQFITLAMTQVAQQHGHTGLVQRLNTDYEFLRSLIGIARQRTSTIRLAVKRVADAHVVAHYNINPGNAIVRVRDLFEWMTYIYPFTDQADGGRSVPWAKPYIHPCVVAVLRAAFVNPGPHSMLTDHPEIFASTHANRPEETEIPTVMAALVATA